VIKYKEDAKKHPRHSVFAGTVNSDEFLRDETGNSRFWVIDIGANPANVDYARINRDRIWAEAYRRWVRGERYWDKELSQKAQERAKEYQVTNSWTEPLEAKLEGLRHEFREIVRTPGKPPKRVPVDVAVTASGLLLSLGVGTAGHSKYTAKLAKALEQLGYVKRKIRVGSKVLTRWAKPDVKPVVLEYDDLNKWRKVEEEE